MAEFRFKTYSLILKEPFGTAHGTRTSTEGVIVALKAGNHTGYGECFMPPYYEEDQESMTAFFKKIDASKLFESGNLNAALDSVANIDHGNTGAKAALDIALHDLFGKRQRVSVRAMYENKWTKDNGQWTTGERTGDEYSSQTNASEGQENEPKTRIPELGTLNPEPGTLHPSPSTQYSYPTSYTIGIDTLENMVRKAAAASEFKTLKIKLSGKNDIEVISALREITDQELFVDANQAWTDVEDAVMIATELVELGVGLIEQPFPVGELEKAGELRDNCAVPVIADEDVQGGSDIEKLASFYDGVNIKLMKCSGLREGFQMILEARNNGLKVLLGCMTESSIGISAAAQLAGFADWCDLDGNLLIENDICTGVRTVAGELKLTDEPGIGITDDSRLSEIIKLNG